jgi:O-acetylserine/cysteine efflux transporter
MNPLHLLFAFCIVLIWGLNFVAIKLGVSGIPPLFLVFARFFFTFFPLIFFVKKPNIPFKKVVSYGLIMFALQFIFLFLGISKGVAPGLASLITQSQVFFSSVLAAIFFGEKPHKAQIIGLITSFSGLAIVANHVNGFVTLEGFIFLLLAAFFWSIGNLISKKMGKTNTLSLIVWSSFIASPPLLCVSLFFEGSDKILFSLQNLNAVSVGALAYITIASTLIGYTVWSFLINHLPLTTVSSFTVLIPIVAMLSSVIIINEKLYPWKIAAASLVISGLLINLFGKNLYQKFLKSKS